MTQQQLADLTGYGDRSSIAKIEKGLVDISQSKLELFASVLRVSAGELMGNEPTPLYEAAAGSGRINDGYTNTISLQLGADEVAVTVKGDSMYPVLCDGDIAIIAATSVVRSDGDIMLVKINGDEATLKYVKKDSDGLYLYAENTDAYKRRFFTAKEVDELPVTIEGVVVRFIREMK